MTCGAGAGAGVMASSLPFSRANEVSAAPDDDGGEYCGALMAGEGWVRDVRREVLERGL
jgi:hypothetical protein